MTNDHPDEAHTDGAHTDGTRTDGGTDAPGVPAPARAVVRRVGRWTGVAGGLVGLLAVAAATVRSQTFSWRGDAISDLGAASASAPWILNGGLIASGAVSSWFAYWLWRDAVHGLQRAGAVAFAMATLALVCVGAFPVGTPVHLPASVAFFAFGTAALVVHGAGTVLSSNGRRSTGVPFGLAHALVWLFWGVFEPSSGLAVPESVGAVLFFAWIVERTLAD